METERAEPMNITDLGDTNGDGFDDLAYYRYNPTDVENTHLIALVYGPLEGTVDAIEQGARFFGTVDDGTLSVMDIRGVGDLSGDGLNDLAIWAPGALDDDGVGVGKVFIFFGMPTGW